MPDANDTLWQAETEYPCMARGRTILLINPRATYVGEIAQKCYPPLNLLYLASSLLRSGHQVEILEANALRLRDEQVREAVEASRADLVGIPVYSRVLNEVRGIAGIVRSALPESRIVLGGPHASAVPELCLEQFPEADFILRGEAEDSIAALAGSLDSPERLDNIPGLSHRTGGVSFVHNPPCDTLAEPSNIAHPARELLAPLYQGKKYYTILIKEKPVETLCTSRGCPFSCAFCYNTAHHYRPRKPDDILQELVSIRERGIRNVEIIDDNFTANKSQAYALFEMFRRECPDMRFRIKSRADSVDEEFISKAGDAGVYQISYGMESGVQELLDAMRKKTTVEQNAEACRLTLKHGMACHTSWIIGYPGDTPERIERTAAFISRIHPTTANIEILLPYPNTHVYLEARENGTLINDWTPDSMTPPWVRLPWMKDRGDLEAMLKKCMRRIYWRPRYIAQFGIMVMRNANILLARYGLQELRKVIFA